MHFISIKKLAGRKSGSEREREPVYRVVLCCAVLRSKENYNNISKHITQPISFSTERQTDFSFQLMPSMWWPNERVSGWVNKRVRGTRCGPYAHVLKQIHTQAHTLRFSVFMLLPTSECPDWERTFLFQRELSYANAFDMIFARVRASERVI